jgi:hypothetical protein
MFEKVTYEFILQALTPIAHHQEVFGNAAQVFRMDVRQPDGEFSKVPYITADTMRHGLREAATYVMLDATGMLDKPSLTEAALRLVFSGGLITGGGAGAVKLDEYWEMVSLMPALALVGGCAQQRPIPGKLFVESALLICEETEHMIPEWQRDPAVVGALSSQRAHVEQTVRVRMDPTLEPSKRLHLTDGEHYNVKQRLLASEAAGEANNAVEKRESKSTMLPRSFEVIKAGSLLSWRVSAYLQTELERDALHTMMGAFLASAQVGGKRGTGHGRLAVLRLKDGTHAAHEVQQFRPAQVAAVSADALALRGAHTLRAHYEQNAERIRAMLAAVQA